MHNVMAVPTVSDTQTMHVVWVKDLSRLQPLLFSGLLS